MILISVLGYIEYRHQITPHRSELPREDRWCRGWPGHMMGGHPHPLIE